MWSVNKLLIAIVLACLGLRAEASLKEQFHMKQKNLHADLISNEVKQIQEDINATWSLLSSLGKFYFVMDKANVRYYGGREVYETTYMRDVTPILVVDRFLVAPLEYDQTSFFWKGELVSCQKRKYWVRPHFLGEADENGFVSFTAGFSRYTGRPVPRTRLRDNFEINIRTGECYYEASRYQGAVRECLLKSFDDFKNAPGTRRNVGKLQDMAGRVLSLTGMNSKELNQCSVAN